MTTVVSDLLSAPRQDLNTQFLANFFEKRINLDCLLAASNLFKRAGTKYQTPAESLELRQLSAKVVHSL